MAPITNTVRRVMCTDRKEHRNLAVNDYCTVVFQNMAAICRVHVVFLVIMWSLLAPSVTQGQQCICPGCLVTKDQAEILLTTAATTAAPACACPRCPTPSSPTTESWLTTTPLPCDQQIENVKQEMERLAARLGKYFSYNTLIVSS